MNILLIIIKPGYDPFSSFYDALYEKIKSTYTSHYEISKTAYLVKTTDSPERVYDELFWEHSNKDLLSIIRFQRPLDVWGSHRLIGWVEENLPETPDTP